MQYQGRQSASALDPFLPASEIPRRGTQDQTQERTVTPSSPFDKPLENSPTGIKFEDMSGTQKCVFAAKLVACIATFGFAFPNVQHD
jgi:hypothetical protein